MKQKDLGLDLSTRRTRKQIPLDEMEQVMPWGELVAAIAPHAPLAKTGRPPFDLAMMLRIHCLQQWFGLSDLGAEEALFETGFYRDFTGISGTQRIPDRVSILRFRHLLEAHELSPKILQIINAKLVANCLLLKSGTVVDATLIAAPSSTKNSTGERDPGLHQVKKGNQWHFGMKAHIDVDWHIAMRPGKRKQQKHTPWGGDHGTGRKTQSQRARQGGASISSHQASARTCQGALSRPCQKHRAAHCLVCPIQYLDG